MQARKCVYGNNVVMAITVCYIQISHIPVTVLIAKQCYHYIGGICFGIGRLFITLEKTRGFEFKNSSGGGRVVFRITVDIGALVGTVDRGVTGIRLFKKGSKN